MMSSTAAEDVLQAQCATQDRATLRQRFDHLLAQEGAALVRLAGSYTNSAGDRDDLLQEIALAVWQALPRFRGECSERTFLFRIAHNRAVDSLAHTRSRQRTSESEPKHDLPDPRPSPEADLVVEQQRERLLQSIRLLPVPFRQVVTLTLEGLEYTEIAQVLGISESNVGARLSRAREMLRRSMEVSK